MIVEQESPSPKKVEVVVETIVEEHVNSIEVIVAEKEKPSSSPSMAQQITNLDSSTSSKSKKKPSDKRKKMTNLLRSDNAHQAVHFQATPPLANPLFNQQQVNTGE